MDRKEVKLTCNRCGHEWNVNPPAFRTCPKCGAPNFQPILFNLTIAFFVIGVTGLLILYAC